VALDANITALDESGSIYNGGKPEIYSQLIWAIWNLFTGRFVDWAFSKDCVFVPTGSLMSL
jgi:hypothetical protein